VGSLKGKVDMSTVKKSMYCSTEAFQRFLFWLHPDQDLAQIHFHEILIKITKIFQYRGSDISKELADQTIYRVIEQIDTIVEQVCNPIQYIYMVANQVFDEDLKQVTTQRPASLLVEYEPDLLQVTQHLRERVECYLSQLSPEEHELLLRYYQEEKLFEQDKKKSSSHNQEDSLITKRKGTFQMRTDLNKYVFNKGYALK
jgi:hypothetical protein